MSEFAFLFRAGRELSSEELARRNHAARDWALARTKEGVLRTAAPLEDGGVSVAGGRASAIEPTSSVVSVLIVEAASLEDAALLARSHPGQEFGTIIEVRPVKAVVPART